MFLNYNLLISSLSISSLLISSLLISSLLTKANELRVANETSPMVVHCSAGIGRSGSFIALDLMLNDLKQTYEQFQQQQAANEQVKQQEMVCEFLDCVNVPKIVKQLRKQRDGMVQTKEQYLMLFDYLNYYLAQQNRAINNN